MGNSKIKRKKFDQAIERKTQPKIPRKFCSTEIDYIFGVASPSLVMIARFQGDKELEEFEMQLSKYMIYKRTMEKKQWKEFDRSRRIERKML